MNELVRVYVYRENHKLAGQVAKIVTEENIDATELTDCDYLDGEPQDLYETAKELHWIYLGSVQGKDHPLSHFKFLAEKYGNIQEALEIFLQLEGDALL